MSLIRKDVDLKDVVAFVYVESMQHGVQNKREVLLDDVSPMHISDEKEGTDDIVSRNAINLEMTSDEEKKCSGCMAELLNGLAD